jgi:arginyl-tRNA synthetase
MDQLSQHLSALGVTNLPQIPSARPQDNPLDIFRSHIAERLAQLAPSGSNVTAEAVFSGLDRSTKPETGDFVLAIPRLRIKQPKPQELGAEWQSKVPPYTKRDSHNSLASHR